MNFQEKKLRSSDILKKTRDDIDRTEEVQLIDFSEK